MGGPSERSGVAIVGCGLIGRKRGSARDGAAWSPARTSARERADALAGEPLGRDGQSTTGRKPSPHPDVDDRDRRDDQRRAGAEVAIGALEAGKHVLVEKPAARTVAELDRLADAAARTWAAGARRLQSSLPSGARQQARDLVDSGALGALMFVRGRYGHGGRVGYEREWRADPARSGGGELIDQGVHLIDLARWFLGTFNASTALRPPTSGTCRSTTTPFCAAHGRRPDGVPARELHRVEEPVLASRSTGATASSPSTASAAATGVERLTLYKMLPEMGPPETTIWEFPARRPTRGRSSSQVSRRHPPRREPRAGLDARARRSRLSRRSMRLRDIDYSSADDHHAQSAAHHARRRRHRSAVLLPRARRLPDRGGDRQVRLRHVMRPFTPGIFLKYSKLEHVDHARRGAASDHPRSDADGRLPDAADRDHDAGRHSRRHRPRLVRAASRRRC